MGGHRHSTEGPISISIVLLLVLGMIGYYPYIWYREATCEKVEVEIVKILSCDNQADVVYSNGVKTWRGRGFSLGDKVTFCKEDMDNLKE